MVGISDHLEHGETVHAFARGILLTEGTTFANITVVLTDRRLLVVSSDDEGRPVVKSYPRELCYLAKSRTRDDGSELVSVRCYDITLGFCFQPEWLADAQPLLAALRKRDRGTVPDKGAAATG